jgi:hypothetical protein
MRALEDFGMIARRLLSLRFFAMKFDSHRFQIRIWAAAHPKISKSVIVRNFGRCECIQGSSNPDCCQYPASEESHREILKNNNSAELLARSRPGIFVRLWNFQFHSASSV